MPEISLAMSQIVTHSSCFTESEQEPESVLVPLRDSRLKLHLHCNCHPLPFVTIDVTIDLPVDK